MKRRKDNKGRVLKDGERQRVDGYYEYRYREFKKQKSIYSKDLNELRAKENKIQKAKLLGENPLAKKNDLK